MSLRRACFIEKWMEKKAADAAAKEKVVLRRNSIADFDKRFLVNSSSSSSSSDSSSGGGFSSASESADSMRSRSASSSSCYSMPRQETTRHQKSNTKQESSTSGYVKTNKTRALKIYGDLKKVKQPISPGGKLATFLNSIFNNGKKQHNKINIDDLSDRNSKSTSSNNESYCSSASSYSRSCLRNGSVSRGEISNESAKRSVRFYPVSVIVDEDCRPCGHKTLEEIKKSSASCFVMEDEDDHRRKIKEVARSYLMKNYNQIKKKTNEDEEMEEDEDDDAASYASSDLFELDTVGVEERYREELPVYETTYLDRNRAIANGLIL